MPKKPDPAAELGEKLLKVLDAQRQLGPAAYPLPLRRLAELTDPAAPADLVQKAVAKKKPFGDRVVLAQAKNLDAPIVLREDLEQLAASPLLLEFAVAAACNQTTPTVEVGKLKAKVPLALRPAFDAALQRAVRENSLPASVAVVTAGKKIYLHDQRFPLPRDPVEQLAEDLRKVLQGQQQLGGTAYPLPLRRLAELTRPGTEERLLKNAVAHPTFAGAVIRGVEKNMDAPLAFTEDGELLARCSLLLETVVLLCRSETGQAFTATDLKAKVNKSIRHWFTDAVRERAEAHNLPPTLGRVWRKSGKNKEWLLFLRNDVTAAQQQAAHPMTKEPSAPSVAPKVSESPDEPSEAFAGQFDAAFNKLNDEAGAHNLVSLAELRPMIPCDRPTFDQELNRLRRAGRYLLKLAEGRHGLSPAEHEAAIVEDGRLLLYVSRKLS